jgi:hypothetical protein
MSSVDPGTQQWDTSPGNTPQFLIVSSYITLSGTSCGTSMALTCMWVWNYWAALLNTSQPWPQFFYPAPCKFSAGLYLPRLTSIMAFIFLWPAFTSSWNSLSLIDFHFFLALTFSWKASSRWSIIRYISVALRYNPINPTSDTSRHKSVTKHRVWISNCIY